MHTPGPWTIDDREPEHVQKLLTACRLVSDGLNTLIDIHGQFLSKLAKVHLTDLQTTLEAAIRTITR